jgi:hypothetical protein
MAKDDSDRVWFKLAQWFQRRRFFKKFTDGRRTPSDGNRSFLTNITGFLMNFELLPILTDYAN